MNSQSSSELPYIFESEIAQVLEWQPLIDTIERAMIIFSAGEVAQPVRQIVPVPGENTIIAAMPAVGEAMAVKVVTLYHDNARLNLPSHQAVILLFDKSNGSPLAVLDGRLITEMRTAAVSAAAARKLAVAVPEVITIMGSGVQARAHAAALAQVRSCSELRLWARNETVGRAVTDELGARFVADAEQAVRDADIVACTTAATEPVLHGDWLKAGAFVTAVGWTPWTDANWTTKPWPIPSSSSRLVLLTRRPVTFAARVARFFPRLVKYSPTQKRCQRNRRSSSTRWA
jgi:ornithine cyclodeaminase/alanine dehydrogenase-like protein (mu-crystallin family)